MRDVEKTAGKESPSFSTRPLARSSACTIQLASPRAPIGISAVVSVMGFSFVASMEADSAGDSGNEAARDQERRADHAEVYGEGAKRVRAQVTKKKLDREVSDDRRREKSCHQRGCSD